MKKELYWWIENLHNQFRIIDHGNPDIVITTDASTLGWGAVYKEFKIGGRWNDCEKINHINYLELLAVFHALKAFCKNKNNIHVGLRIDNTCAIAYINNMGGIKSIKCNKLANQIWHWCISQKIWLSAEYVQSSKNIADSSSRLFNDNVEWMLCRHVFNCIVDLWGIPNIDMFASRLNKQISRFVSWKPDPDSTFVNAFSLSWTELYFYAFPPFSLIGQCVQKLRRDGGECIFIAPIWPTQSWYPQLMQLLVDHPVILPKKDNLLTICQYEKLHPLHKKLTLMACRLSGNFTKTKTFLLKQPIYYCHPGGSEPKNSTVLILKNGKNTVVKDRLVQFAVL